MGDAILHMISFTWRAGTEREAVQEFHRRVTDFAATCDGVGLFVAGGDAGIMPGNADYGIVATFDTLDAFEAYRNAPEHLRLIEESLLPIVDGRSRLQILDPRVEPQPVTGANRPPSGDR